MVSAIEIFDATVDEALFSVLADAEEADVAAVLMTLTLMVDDLTAEYVAEQLAPAMPATIEEDGERIINPLWSDSRTFAPLFALLAKLYYETIAPSDFPRFPVPRITQDPATMFGVRFDGFDAETSSTLEGECLGVFAGSCTLAVVNCFQQPVTVALGYLLSSKWRANSVSA